MTTTLSGSWQDWSFVIGYVGLLAFVIFMVLRPKRSDSD